LTRRKKRSPRSSKSSKKARLKKTKRASLKKMKQTSLKKMKKTSLKKMSKRMSKTLRSKFKNQNGKEEAWVLFQKKKRVTTRPHEACSFSTTESLMYSTFL
jgi:hypothetical protein